MTRNNSVSPEPKAPEKSVVLSKPVVALTEPKPTEPIERKRLINDEFLAKLREKTTTQSTASQPTEPIPTKNEYIYQ